MGLPDAIVVMGVSGCGKSTVGALLAERLGYAFLDGDDVHPPENIARMASGQPLRDEDREGWLVSIGQAIADTRDAGKGVVVACSALRRHYRDILREQGGAILFVHLAEDAVTISQRLSERRGHFMPTTLMDSQFATLEPTEPDETSIVIRDCAPADAVDRVIAMMRG